MLHRQRESSASRSTLIVVGVIAGAEFVAMWLFHELSSVLPWWTESWVDAASIGAIVAPVLWFGIVRPMRSENSHERAWAQAIVETTSDAIVAVDKGGRIQFFNPAATAMFGWSVDEAIGQSFTILVGEPHREIQLASFAEDQRHPEGRFPRSMPDVPYVRKDGTQFVADVTLGLMRAGDLEIVAFIRDATARHEAEARVRVQESMSRSLIENCNDILGLITAEGTIRYASPAFERTLGHSVAAWNGRNLFELVDPEDLAMASSLFQQALDCHGLPVSWQLRARHADGTNRWLEGTTANLLQDPTVGAMVLSCHDVTERKQAELQLRTLSRGIEQSPASIVITDRHGYIEYVNPRFCAVTGYSADEVRGQNPRVLKSGLTPEGAYQELWHTILAGREWRGEFHNRRKNGEVYWELASISPIHDESGTIVHFLAVKEDITERKRTEMELHARTHMLLETQRVARLGAYQLSLRSMAWTSSPLLDEIFGITNTSHPRDIRGWLTIVHPDDRTEMAAYLMNDVLAKRQSFDREYRIVRVADGAVRWVHGRGEFVAEPGEHASDLIGTIQDITAHKATQERLAAHALELEEANARLRREQDERAKVEAELRLAQKLEAIGQLAAGIAHEINTPMQYIGDSARFLVTAFGGITEALLAYHGALRALCQNSGNEPVRAELDATLERVDLEFMQEEIPRALDRVLDGTSRVTGIVRAMKEFAHPDAGERVGSDLNRMLATTLTVARNEYKLVADIETDFATLPPVMCNVGELNQVFLNLIVNAAHAVGDVVARTHSKGRIALRTRLEGDEAIVEIEDSGGGIPEAIRARVFEPFFTTKEVGRGTGQGLAIARSIVVDKHGGSLTFDSVEGKGTIFVIRLPVAARVQIQEAA